MKKLVKTIIFVLLLIVMWIPIIQETTSFFKEPVLDGAYVKPLLPKISLDSIKTLSYQKNIEKYLNNEFGFRSFLVKLKNSWEYLVFNQINSDFIVEGKNGFLFDKNSIKCMNGTWYNGIEQTENALSKIYFMQKSIEKNGKHLFIIFAPSKESIYPELIPDSLQVSSIKKSDYKDFIKGFADYKIPYINFYLFVKQFRKTSPYPVFPKTGFHWSYYCASFVQDSLLSYIQKLLPSPMPSYTRKGVDSTIIAKPPEDDLEKTMNVLFKLNTNLFYNPRLEMVQSTLKNSRPKVIINGDSYFWQIKDLKNLANIFSEDSRYWYYFSQNHPLDDGPINFVSEIDAMREIGSSDIIILNGSFGTMNKFPFGITDYYFNKMAKPGIIENIKEIIQNDPEWKKQLTVLCNEKNIRLTRLINQEAINVFLNKSTIQLKANNNKYVCADAGQNHIVVADKEKGSSWETFNVLHLNNNKVIIYSFEDKFVSANIDGIGEITAFREKALGWEIFTMEKLDNGIIALKSSNGKYLTVDEKTNQLFARSITIGSNEKFKLIYAKN